MKYVLVDTNNWIYLITDEKAEQIIDELELKIASNEIGLLIPDVIIAEWKSYFKEEKQRPIKKQIDTALQHRFSKADLSTAVESLSRVSKGYQDRIIKRINALLENGIVLTRSEKVSHLIVERMDRAQAPFHNKDKSLGDALIYFIALDYLISNAINEFYFFTNNRKDFSNPDASQEVHPDLRSNGITVHYRLGQDLLYSFLFPEGRRQENSDISGYIRESICFDPEIKKLPILDQWYLTLQHYLQEIPYIPFDILGVLHPHKAPNKGGAGVSNGKLYVSNPELIQLLRTIRIEEGSAWFEDKDVVDGVAGPEEKLAYILRALKSNLIFEIEDHERTFKVDISTIEITACNCIRCSFEDLDFDRVLDLLKMQPGKDVADNLKQAYVHYQLGNFATSCEFYLSCYNEYHNRGLEILKFICAINIGNVKRLVNIHEPDRFFEIERKVKFIDTEAQFILLLKKDQFSKRIAKHLFNNHFFYTIGSEIDSFHRSIASQYQGQKRGDHRSNSNIQSLLFTTADLQLWLSRNCITGDHFRNYSDLYEKVFEGYVMAFGLNQYQESRLLYFDNFLLLQAAHFAAPDTIIKLHNRYHPGELIYSNISVTSADIYSIVVTLIKSYSEIIGRFKERVGRDHVEHFEEQLVRRINTILSFASLANTSTETINVIGESLRDFLKNYPYRGYRSISGLNQFIGRKGRFLRPDILRELIVIGVNNQELHRSDIFDAFDAISKWNNCLFDGDPDAAQMISNTLIEECATCRGDHLLDLALDIFPFLPMEQQAVVRAEVERRLKVKFDSKLYYINALYGIIDYRTWFADFMSSVPSATSFKDYTNPFFHGELVSPQLSDLLNLTFRFGIDTTEDELERFKGGTDYYDWLLDMDSFDYGKFKIEWITEYSTDAYFGKIFTNQKVIEVLMENFKDSRNDYLMRKFFRYRVGSVNLIVGDKSNSDK